MGKSGEFPLLGTGDRRTGLSSACLDSRGGGPSAGALPMFFATAVQWLAYTKADEKFLKKLNDIIDSHINDVNLDVDMIADLMNLSRPTLYRKINGLSNVTPNELIKISRLKKAAELILQGDMRIYEIVEAVGFNSQSYFSRAFSKQFNMSPSQYAKENNIELK